MTELSAFERRLAEGLEAVAGPSRHIDAMAITRTAAIQGPVRNGVGSRLSARIGLGARARGSRPGDLGAGRKIRPLVVLVVVALFTALVVGVVAVGSGLVRQTSVVPPVVPTPTPPSMPTSTPPATLAPSTKPSAAVGTGSWTITGRMAHGQFGETATLLPDGRVLAVGGMPTDNVVSASAELYDPISGEWAGAQRMHTARSGGHSATLLQDGRVLVAGGSQAKAGLQPQDSAELYDPSTGAWTVTGSMELARSGHSATLLSDGKVLVVGGHVGGYRDTKSAALYDPATGWTATGSMMAARAFPSAALLPDGTVLVVGASDSDVPGIQSAELYDPRVGTWSPASSFAGVGGCRIAAPLSEGDVLVVCAEANGARTSAALYDPVADAWSTTASPPKECCIGEAGPFGSFVLLSDGRVLWKDLVDPGELYDPATGSWASAGGPTYPADPSWRLPYTVTDEGSGYKADTLTLLPDGRVLMTTLGAGLLYDPNPSSP